MNKLPKHEHFSISALYRDNCATVRGRMLCVRLCTKIANIINEGFSDQLIRALVISLIN